MSQIAVILDVCVTNVSVDDSMRQFGAMYRCAIAAATSQRQEYSNQNRFVPLHHFPSWH
jgi:hypothetical protein